MMKMIAIQVLAYVLAINVAKVPFAASAYQIGPHRGTYENPLVDLIIWTTNNAITNNISLCIILHVRATPWFFQPEKRLTLDTISPNLRKMAYAVRGEVVIKADEINQQLHASDDNNNKKDDKNNQNKNDGVPTTTTTTHPQHAYPFDHIVYTNIGNPQSVGQKPLTWPRQVAALVDLPDEAGVDHPQVTTLFPADAVRRAKEIKEGLSSSSGAYTHSQGAKCFRNDIASFIEKRDGVPSNPDDIFMTNGASSAINMVMQVSIFFAWCDMFTSSCQLFFWSIKTHVCICEIFVSRNSSMTLVGKTKYFDEKEGPLLTT